MHIYTYVLLLRATQLGRRWALVGSGHGLTEYTYIYIYIYFFFCAPRSSDGGGLLLGLDPIRARRVNPVNPVLDRNMFLFKVTVFIKRAKYEYKTVFYSVLRISNMLDLDTPG